MTREFDRRAGHGVREIEALFQALEDAVVRADPDALEHLFSDDICAVFSGTDGPIRGREAVMATWQRHLGQWSDVRIARRQTVVRIHGDVAWGHFVWDGEGRAAGGRYRLEGERWTVVVLREGGRWRVVQTHTSMPYGNWESHRVGRQAAGNADRLRES